MRRGSQTLILSTVALTLATPALTYAGSATDTVKQYTRNEKNYVYITQSVLALTDTAVLGASVKAYMALRPRFQEMARLQQEVKALEVKEREVRVILDRVTTGQLALNDDFAKAKIMEEIEGEITRLNNNRRTLEQFLSTANGSLRPDGLERRTLEHNVSQISGEIRGREKALASLKSVKIAASYEQTVSVISQEITKVRDDLAKARMTLGDLKGNIITRAAKSGLRLVATAAGLIAVTDLGTRAYVVFIEKADPGTFPVLEIAAKAYDQNRDELEKARKEIETTLNNAQEIGSAMIENIDLTNFPSIR